MPLRLPRPDDMMLEVSQQMIVIVDHLVLVVVRDSK